MELRSLSGRCTDGAQVRRLLALALVLDGYSRTEAAALSGMDGLFARVEPDGKRLGLSAAKQTLRPRLGHRRRNPRRLAKALGASSSMIQTASDPSALANGHVSAPRGPGMRSFKLSHFSCVSQRKRSLSICRDGRPTKLRTVSSAPLIRPEFQRDTVLSMSPSCRTEIPAQNGTLENTWKFLRRGATWKRCLGGPPNGLII